MDGWMDACMHGIDGLHYQVQVVWSNHWAPKSPFLGSQRCVAGDCIMKLKDIYTWKVKLLPN